MPNEDSITMSVNANACTLKNLKNHSRLVIDMTSASKVGTFRKFSPTYIHEQGIPVPGMKDTRAMSIKGIYEGLKEFQHEGIDLSRFCTRNQRRLPGRTRGLLLGHSYMGERLEDPEAVWLFVLEPSLRYKLDNYLELEMYFLKQLVAEGNTLVLVVDKNEYSEKYFKTIKEKLREGT